MATPPRKDLKPASPAREAANAATRSPQPPVDGASLDAFNTLVPTPTPARSGAEKARETVEARLQPTLEPKSTELPPRSAEGESPSPPAVTMAAPTASAAAAAQARDAADWRRDSDLEVAGKEGGGGAPQAQTGRPAAEVGGAPAAAAAARESRRGADTGLQTPAPETEPTQGVDAEKAGPALGGLRAIDDGPTRIGRDSRGEGQGAETDSPFGIGSPPGAAALEQRANLAAQAAAVLDASSPADDSHFRTGARSGAGGLATWGPGNGAGASEGPASGGGSDGSVGGTRPAQGAGGPLSGGFDQGQPGGGTDLLDASLPGSRGRLQDDAQIGLVVGTAGESRSTGTGSPIANGAVSGLAPVQYDDEEGVSAGKGMRDLAEQYKGSPSISPERLAGGLGDAMRQALQEIDEFSTVRHQSNDGAVTSERRADGTLIVTNRDSGTTTRLNPDGSTVTTDTATGKVIDKTPAPSEAVDPDGDFGGGQGAAGVTPSDFARWSYARQVLGRSPAGSDGGVTDPADNGSDPIDRSEPVTLMQDRAVDLVGQPARDGAGMRGGGSFDTGRLPGDMGNIDYGPDSTGAWAGDTRTESEADALGTYRPSLGISDANDEDEQEDDSEDAS